MKNNLDEGIVAAWLDPVSLRDMLAALRDTGFSGDVYRGKFADLNATLEDDEAGALHFLRHGYAEGRIFQIGLNLAGFDRLRLLPVPNRVYLQNLFVALILAWTGVNIRSSADLTTHRPTLERFKAMGGMPIFILGDAAASFYRQSVSLGDRWICPLAMAPLEGGIKALLHTSPLAPRWNTDQGMVPTIWEFGQSDVQTEYLIHCARRGVISSDVDAFLNFAVSMIKKYTTFLAAVVPVQERREHWIASLFPPVSLAIEADPLMPTLVAKVGVDLEDKIVAGFGKMLDQTIMYRKFNSLLEKTVIRLGFNVLSNFDCFLAAHGVIDEQYTVATPNLKALDYAKTRGVISTSLWNIIDGNRTAAPSTSIQEQFDLLLKEICMVQMDSAE